MQNSPPLPRRKTLWLALGLLAAAVVLGVSSLMLKPQGGPASSGTALVGGPFTMVNQNGETVSEKAFAGKYMLIFFGYTYCPDVCPATLQVMGKALDKIGPTANRLAPIFVSIDPERDDVATMKAYVEAIDPRFTGLTGSPEQVAAMASAYRVFYSKLANAERPGDYLMDHSSIIYLMAPDGRFLRHFNYDIDSATLADGLSQAVQ